MMTDPIADMLTRIRNAYKVRRAEVTFPYSKLKLKICEILVREGYVQSAEVTSDALKQITVILKYVGRQPSINVLTRISKPGSRRYVQAASIGRVLNGYGVSIFSTSKGLLTGQEARAAKVGGELICEIS